MKKLIIASLLATAAATASADTLREVNREYQITDKQTKVEVVNHAWVPVDYTVNHSEGPFGFRLQLGQSKFFVVEESPSGAATVHAHGVSGDTNVVRVNDLGSNHQRIETHGTAFGISKQNHVWWGDRYSVTPTTLSVENNSITSVEVFCDGNNVGGVAFGEVRTVHLDNPDGSVKYNQCIAGEYAGLNAGTGNTSALIGGTTALAAVAAGTTAATITAGTIAGVTSAAAISSATLAGFAASSAALTAATAAAVATAGTATLSVAGATAAGTAAAAAAFATGTAASAAAASATATAASGGLAPAAAVGPLFAVPGLAPLAGAAAGAGIAYGIYYGISQDGNNYANTVGIDNNGQQQVITARIHGPVGYTSPQWVVEDAPHLRQEGVARLW